MTDSAAMFIDQLPDHLRVVADALDGLHERLEALSARGETAWPSLALEPGAFVRGLAASLRTAPANHRA